MKTFIALFTLAVIIKLFTNVFRMLATKRYFRIYQKGNSNILEYASSVERLFNIAGTQREVIVTTRHAVKQMSKTYISECLNDSQYKKDLTETFTKTIGEFKRRARESFYPSFWCNLPIYVLKMFNIELGKSVSILINIIGWVINFTASYFLEKLLDHTLLSDFFSILDNLLK